MHQWSNTIALYFFKPTHALLLHTVSICMSSSFAGVCVCDHLQIWCLELCVDRSWPQNLVAGAFFLALWTHHECLPDRRPGAGHHGDDCELLRKGRALYFNPFYDDWSAGACFIGAFFQIHFLTFCYALFFFPFLGWQQRRSWRSRRAPFLDSWRQHGCRW